eukprot:496829-Prorocentrum_minimum.AAC.1
MIFHSDVEGRDSRGGMSGGSSDINEEFLPRVAEALRHIKDPFVRLYRTNCPNRTYVPHFLLPVRAQSVAVDSATPNTAFQSSCMPAGAGEMPPSSPVWCPCVMDHPDRGPLSSCSVHVVAVTVE